MYFANQFVLFPIAFVNNSIILLNKDKSLQKKGCAKYVFLSIITFSNYLSSNKLQMAKLLLNDRLAIKDALGKNVK